MRGDSPSIRRRVRGPGARRAGPAPILDMAAFLLPFLGAIWLTRGDALWRTDEAILSTLGGQAHLSGALGSLLGKIFLVLPLGSHAFRIALPGAMALGLAGVSVLRLSYWLFKQQGGDSRLDPWLALGASLSVSFSLVWLQEASVAGGAALGAGLTLCLLVVLLVGGLPRTLFGAFLGGLATGALVTESPWCVAVLCLSALVAWPESEALRDPRFLRTLANGLPSLDKLLGGHLGHSWKLLALFLGALTSVALLALPSLANQSASSLAALTQGADVESLWPLWSPLSWFSQLGFLWVCAAGVALLFALSERRPFYGLLLFAVADFLVPGSRESGHSAVLQVEESRLALHLVALGIAAPMGALGLRTLSETAQALKLFAARPLGAMVAVLAVASCLAGAEDSVRILERRGSAGTQAWTDEALSALPYRSLVITHSPAWGRRLLAAQAQGGRPDILVLPLNDVGKVGTLQAWLDQEPALEYLLRDLSTSETPSERAVARLVDERPVFLEADPKWDRRLLEHLKPGTPLVEFSSHALARSDRIAALDLIMRPRQRIESAYQEGLQAEAATQKVQEEALGDLMAVLEEARDKGSLAYLKKLLPSEEGDKDGEGKLLAPVAVLEPRP